ncbi:MAG: DUF3040 domain-containing protein [Candidatus Nanopelagicales bacterium]|jgi:VIT1/CCC1 family predicted Fe2+/Mn2+ transporter
MPLSEHEQRLLEQMEQALYAEDPKFATSLRHSSAGRASRGRAALGVIVFFVGIAVLLGGAITPLIPLGVAGFALMMVGALLAYLGLRPGPATAEGDTTGAGAAQPGSGGGKAGRAPKASGGFMRGLEDRWQRRREDGPGGN